MEESQELEGPFSTLPTELITPIFDQLCIEDTICLGLVSQRFWDIGWPYMEKKLMASMAPWAGHRLLCVGEDTFNYPPDVLSINERKELAQGLTPDELAVAKRLAVNKVLSNGLEGGNSDYYMEYSMHACTDEPIDLYKIACLRYTKTKAHDIPPPCSILLLQHIAQHERCSMPRSVLSKIAKFTDDHLPNYYLNDRKWVLRNLTTHEFIRSEVLAGNSEQHGPFFEDVGFEHIILSKIFWSSMWRCTSINDRDVDGGIWAGHCLEITTLDHHTESLLSDVPWKDISEEAVEDIIHLCRAADWIRDARSK